MTMRLHRSLFVACVLALPALVVAQSSVTGQWAGEVQGGRGPQAITLNLTADGSKLTGALTGGRGGDIAIEEGTISGNMIKFKTKLPNRNGGGEVTMVWSGTVKGDEIAFSRVQEGGQGQAQEFALKRKK